MAMASSSRAAKQNRAGPADADAGAGQRGVVTGKYFNFTPLPPQADVLGKPLVVTDLPTHKLPKETLRSRFQRVLSRLNIGRQSGITRLRWKVHDTITSVIASVSASVTLSPEQRAKIRRNGQDVPVVIVRHPYHLRHVLDMIPLVPDELMLERRFLELLMSRIVRKYGEQMALMKGSAFSFENESKEYLYAAFKLEKQLKKVTSPDERFAALQAIYTNYFHGRNYYYYALLRREKLLPENKLFMLFTRACYFMARVDWNGELMEKPNPRTLPSRGFIVFHLQRDKTVLVRSKSDEEFQRQIKSVIEAFPE